jgi:hypothetical protein
MKPAKFPVFPGGCNVFDWIVLEAQQLRALRQRENRDVAEAAKESKRLELRKMAHEERKAIDAGSERHGRKVSPRLGN